jgi:surfactin synthase thioesterase subunit
VVATRLDFLVPAGVDPDRVARIQIGPSNDRHQLVGIVDEVGHVVCADPDQAAGTCGGHRVFDLYQALTEARIDIRAVRISARTAPGPSLPPRTPRPATSGSDGTFSIPLSTPYEWSTTEPRIPPET